MTDASNTPTGNHGAPGASAKAFVCGWPITHSRSPLIHGYWLKQYGIAGSYEKIAVEPGTLDRLIDRLRAGEFAGGNVTIPHKEEALRLVDEADAAARAIGAVNTLFVRDGRVAGTNTDWFGFAANLDRQVPDWTDAASGDRCAPRSRALVIGAGGAARGILYALIGRGFNHIHLVNRTVEKAEALAAEFSRGTARVVATGFETLSELAPSIDLLVNTSSMGMVGQPAMAQPLLDLIAGFPGHAVVADIVYVPLETGLLAAARAHGLRTADGLGMLLHQAVPGFEKWFGVRPEVSEGLRHHVLADLAEKQA
ncbi:MAG: shikimate dehydrogenase [Nitratireductor sp.]|nr:shikimate dehydrogenase [Nitratireductor sp.]